MKDESTLTINNVKDLLGCVRDFKWGDGVSFDDCAAYIWNNYDRLGDDNRDDAIRSYLVSAGHDPTDYGL